MGLVRARRRKTRIECGDWSATGLQTGLTINANTGVISGTPTATGTASVTVTMTDAARPTATRTYSLTINAAPRITTASLPNGPTGPCIQRDRVGRERHDAVQLGGKRAARGLGDQREHRRHLGHTDRDR